MAGGVLGWAEQVPGAVVGLAQEGEHATERDIHAATDIGRWVQEHGTKPAPYGHAVGEALRTVLVGGKGGKGDPSPDAQEQGWLDKAAKAKAVQPKGPTEAQDISAALSTYMDAMSSLGPEYGKEMEYLKPYLNPGAQTFSGLLNTAALQASPTGNTAVNAAGQQLAQASAAGPTPGFGHAADMMRAYEKSIPAAGPLQAALAYQKSLQTYGGQQPTTAGWSPAEKAAYQSITGTPLTPAGGGINVTPASAAAQGNANTLLSLSGLTGSGSASSATGG
jgi:hypothetical protein